jgi:hypothetical protein
MNLLEGLTNPSWLTFAVVFLVIMIGMVYLRQRDTKRVQEKFDRSQIIITSFGVNYFGLESEPGGPLRSSGALVLVKDGLWYRARFANRELFIPGPSITYIGVTHTHKGKELHQHVIAIHFLNSEGKEEKAAFRLPLPAQWVAAIKAHLVGDRRLREPEPDREAEQSG